jgi:hypothetical protein
MARFATLEVNTAGLYRWLEQRERASCAEWEQREQGRMENGYASRAYPRRRRWDAFAAGAPVNVDPGEIWGWSAVHSEGARNQASAAGSAGEGVAELFRCGAKLVPDRLQDDLTRRCVDLLKVRNGILGVIDPGHCSLAAGL